MSKFSIINTVKSVSLLFLAAFSGVLFAVHTHSDALLSKTLEIHTIEYPPFMMRQNSADSVIARVYDDFFDITGFNYKFVFNPLPRVNLIVKEGHWCLTNIAPVVILENIASLNLPFPPLDLRLYRLTDDTRFYWEKLYQLKGKKLAILRSRNTTSTAEFLEAGIDLVKTNNIKQSFALLFLKRVDYVISNELTSRYMVSELGKANHQIQKSENVIIAIQPKLWFNLNCPKAKTAFHALKNKYPHL